MKYKELEGLTIDGQIYKNKHMDLLEAIIPPGEFATAHAPTLIELDNGDTLCAWFAGSFEGSADISIVCARLEKDSNKWEVPVKVSNDDTRSEQNPSFFIAPDKAVWLMYTSQESRVEGKDNMQFTSVIKYQKSYDYGKTWSEAEVLIDEPGSFCRQEIQVLSSGRWIFGNWICTDSESGLEGDPTAFRISDDKGSTWKTVEMPNSNGRVHANVIELEPKHLVAFMRSRYADNVYKSESKDNGDTWSEPIKTDLPNNNSSISTIKLNSGRLAIAYNPSSLTDPTFGKVAWPGLRCPVAIALSEDGGKTWPMIRVVELGEGFIGSENRTNNKQYEYPYLMQDTNDNLNLVFAYNNRLGIKYMKFSEEDIMGEKRETIGLYNPTSAKVS